MGIQADMYGDDILELSKIYRGIVENVDDPEKAGRVKIRVFGVHSDNPAYVKTEHLPWAIPGTSMGMVGGGLRNIGTHNVPSIGSHVYLFFEGGDHNFPVYFSAAPAIEDVQDYQQKEGKFQDNEYQYLKKSQYDDDSGYSDKKEKFETPNDDKIEHPIQDWSPQTRKNTFGEGGEFSNPPPKKDEDDEQPIFPEDFFIDSVRIAFDGAANHDSPGYNGIHTTKPSNYLTETEIQQELDEWAERKWGFNDDDEDHQHNFDGGSDWKPEYPMVNTERNAQGEILDLDILKERRTFIHPSKYYLELIQLDASRLKNDFMNEQSIKKVYERQRGVANTPDLEWSNPKEVTIDGESNSSEAINSTEEGIERRLENEITYDDIEGEERQQRLGRFEERKHNPGREKTIIEDFVYRYYMNKVNETYQSDRNVRFYVGNDNQEIEHGDRNYRLHRGSHNQHIDEGNYNRVVNRGWDHTHIDEGHQFIEICGVGTGSDGSAYNSFDVSVEHEDIGNPDHCANQHGSSDARPNHPKTDETLASKLGCNAKFEPWEWDGENDCGNQFYLIHNGSQIFRIVDGHQHFHLLDGSQKFDLENGHQTFHLQNGDQRFQLNGGDMERLADGHRYSLYEDSCVEDSSSYWRLGASSWFGIKAPTIVLDGDVRITGNIQVDGTIKLLGDMACASSMSVSGGIDTPGITGVAVGIQSYPASASAEDVDEYSANNPLTFKSC